MSKIADVLLDVTAAGLIASATYFGAIHKGADGYNIMQRAGLAIGTPQQAECAREAGLVGLALGAGSILTVSRLKKYNM